MSSRIGALIAIFVAAIPGAAFASEAASQARKDNPFFEDDADMFTFPGLVRRYDDAAYLGVNTGDGKGIDAGQGGIILGFTDLSLGFWATTVPNDDLDRGVAGVPLKGTLTDRPLQLIIGMGPQEDALGFLVGLDYSNPGGPDNWAFALSVHGGKSKRTSVHRGWDVAGGLSLHAGKLGESDTFVGLDFDGGFRIFVPFTDWDLGIDVRPAVGLEFYGENGNPDVDAGSTVSARVGPRVMTDIGLTVAGYVGLGAVVQKFEGEDGILGFNLPLLGVALDYTPWQWLTFHAGVSEGWYWSFVKNSGRDGAGGSYIEGNDPAGSSLQSFRDPNAGSGWNIGATLEVRGFKTEIVIQKAFLTGGPNIFQAPFWANVPEGWITFSWGWDEKKDGWYPERTPTFGRTDEAVPVAPAKPAEDPAAEEIPPLKPIEPRNNKKSDAGGERSTQPAAEEQQDAPPTPTTRVI